MPLSNLNRAKSPHLDMNPMVDMAFLLVTFFLLATTFKTPEPVNLSLPKSVSNLQFPDQNVIQIYIDRNGAVHISMVDQALRKEWLAKFGNLYNIEFTEYEKERFSRLVGFGVPADELIEFLQTPQEQKFNTEGKGIPITAERNELSDWLILARSLIPNARFAIKSDRKTPYVHVDKVIKTLVQNQILRFNLVTEFKRNDGI